MVRPAKRCIGAELTTPSARNKVASRFLIDRAASPPLRGGESRALHQRPAIAATVIVGFLHAC